MHKEVKDKILYLCPGERLFRTMCSLTVIRVRQLHIAFSINCILTNVTKLFKYEYLFIFIFLMFVI